MGRRAKRKIQQKERKRTVEEEDVRKRWEHSEIQGKIHKPTLTHKKGTTEGFTEVLPRPEELAKILHCIWPAIGWGCRLQSIIT